jgi:hypothetical protein
MQKYGQYIQSICVRHAILSCLYRLKVNQCCFGHKPALRHLTESYRHTRQEINNTDHATDVLYAVIFMMLGAILDDRYDEFYAHALAFNASLEFQSRNSQFTEGETAFGAIWVAAFAILYYRRPKHLLAEPPGQTWALEDRFLESCRRLLVPLGKAAESKILVGWLRIHMYFSSVGKAAEDATAKWPSRPLKVEFPRVEVEEFVRPEMKPGSSQLIGFVNFMPFSRSGSCLEVK